MATKKRSKTTTRRRKTSPAKSDPMPRIPFLEIGGMMVVALGLFMVLALVSFDAGVPPGEQLGHAGGLLGAHLGDLMTGLMGYTAFVLPIAVIYGGIQLLRHGFTFPRVRPIFGIGLMVGAVASLLHLQLVQGRGANIQVAGGALGETFGALSHAYLGGIGAYLMLFCVFLLSLQVALGLSIAPVVDRVALWFQQLVPIVFRWAGQAATDSSSVAGSMVRERLVVWRESRNLPEELEELAQLPAPKKRGGRKVKVNGADSEEALEVVAEVVAEPGSSTTEALPTAVPEGEGGDSTPTPSGEALRERPLEEVAAAYRARRLAQGAGPKIVKNQDAQRIAQEGASATGALDSGANENFELPPLDLLQVRPADALNAVNEEELRESARILEEKLRDYGVDGEVVEIHPGPIITMFEYVPAPGIKVSKITNLSNDLAMALAATRIRIVAPIPGKAAVGIEVPNRSREIVYLRESLAHESFRSPKLRLPIALGKDTEGTPFAADMAKMPHLLVAGATGTGKSVAVNSMILSLIFSRTPEEVRLILVDPKMLEFSMYNDIPHLLLPVVNSPKKAAQALSWAVDEMVRRYKLLAKVGTRNIDNYNVKVEEEHKRWEKHGGVPPEFIPWEEARPGCEDEEPKPPEKLPYIVIIIDELADLMMVAAKEVQDYTVRLAQMARAAGIHLLLATQRPSVDVITGLIKANFPSRISFQVSSKTDSRTILDTNGAEHLLGMGDLLYLPPGVAQLKRFHAPFCSDDEVKLVTDFVKSQGEPQYEQSLIASVAESDEGTRDPDEDYDDRYDEAVAIVTEKQQCSISGIQRRLKIGYNRAARIVETMEREGVVSEADRTGKRVVLAKPIEF